MIISHQFSRLQAYLASPDKMPPVRASLDVGGSICTTVSFFSTCTLLMTHALLAARLHAQNVDGVGLGGGGHLLADAGERGTLGLVKSKT